MEIEVGYQEIVPKSQPYANWRLSLSIRVNVDDPDDVAAWQDWVRAQVVMHKAYIESQEDNDGEAFQAARIKPPKGVKPTIFERMGF